MSEKKGNTISSELNKLMRCNLTQKPLPLSRKERRMKNFP